MILYINIIAVECARLHADVVPTFIVKIMSDARAMAGEETSPNPAASATASGDVAADVAADAVE